MAISAGRGQAALRRARWSVAGAEYFLTICTNRRRRGLEDPLTQGSILAAAKRMNEEAVWKLRTAVVMRDQVHLLIALGERMELAEAVRLFKGRSSVALRRVGLLWQAGYFEHRMRNEEKLLPVFQYIFLNPYHSSLLNADEKWAGYFCSDEDWAWFAPLTQAEEPFPE